MFSVGLKPALCIAILHEVCQTHIRCVRARFARELAINADLQGVRVDKRRG
jgi:hypothetical protein